MFKKISFLLTSRRSMTKIAGSGQRHGSADPDPHQNVMDPQSMKAVVLACVIAQSRQSTRPFLQSSELGPPDPLTCKRVCTLLLWF
jgi:hypothetical protein